MSIEKRIKSDGKTSYRVKIFDKQRVVSSASFKNKPDAIEWEREQLYNVNKQKYFPQAITKIKFEELFKYWLQNHAEPRKAPSSLKRDKQIYKDYLAPNLAYVFCNEITYHNIDRIIGTMIKTGRIKNKTVNNIMQLLKTVLNYGVKKRYLSINPMASIEKLPVTEQTLRYWSKEEVLAFLNYTSHKYRDNRASFVLYLLLLSTGLRIGEAIGLKWSNVSFDNGLFTISHTYDRVQNKVKEGTKGKRIRYIGINEDLLYELKLLKVSSGKAEYVFINQNGGNVDPDNFKKRNFEKDIVEAGVPRIRIHDLRHTFASHYMMNNGNLYELQKILGHADAKTTMRYAHLAPSHIAHTAGIVKFDYKTRDANVVKLQRTA